MKLVARSSLVEEPERNLTLAVDDSGSPPGQPVLLEDGLAVGTLRSVLARYTILEATPEERATLEAAGYFMSDSES